MGDKRTKQVFTIIICIGLIIASIFWKMFKDYESDSQENKSTETSVNAKEQTNEGWAAEGIYTYQSLITEKPKSEKQAAGEITPDVVNVSDQEVEDTPISEIDISLYEENSESEAAPDGKEIRIALINGDVLYSGGYPSGIFKDMMANIQDYINTNIKNPEEITEVTINEASIQEDKDNKKLQYDVTLNNKTQLAVEVDLRTFEYHFTVNG